MVTDTERNDEITLAELIRPARAFLAEANRPLLRLSLACALAGAVVVSLNPRYDASALLDTPNLTLDEWRDLKPLLYDHTLVRNYLDGQKQVLGDAQVNAMVERMANESYWDTHTTFRTTLQRGDEKIAPNAQVAKTSTLGVELAMTASSKDSGLASLGILAGYIQSTIHWINLKRSIQSFTQAVDRQRTEIDASLVRQDFAIEQSTRRIAEMKRLLTQYPESRRLENNAVVSVEGGGDKFLSPIAQLIALETTIFDANAAKHAAQRELEKLDWKIRYAKAIAGAADKYHSGKALDAFLVRTLQEVFAQGNVPSTAALEEYYDVSMKLTALRQRAETFVFKGSPRISEKPIRSRNPYFMGAATFGASYALLALLFWTRRRQDETGEWHWIPASDPWFHWLPDTPRRWLFGR